LIPPSLQIQYCYSLILIFPLFCQMLFLFPFLFFSMMKFKTIPAVRFITHGISSQIHLQTNMLWWRELQCQDNTIHIVSSRHLYAQESKSQHNLPCDRSHNAPSHSSLAYNKDKEL
jgi:hypothetical protein